MRIHPPLKNFSLQAGVVLIVTCLLLSACNSEKNSALTTAEVTQKAPEIISKGTHSETIKLSDFRNKLVLVEFWCTTSSDCKKNRFELNRVFNEFKNREFKHADGFTVFSVSLDTVKENWLSAVEESNVSWTNEVNDLKGWYSEAAMSYAVNTLPKYFLIDGDGTILNKYVAINDLENILSNELK